MLSTSVAELISLSALLPFLSLLTTPERSFKIFSVLPGDLPFISTISPTYLPSFITLLFISAITVTTLLRLMTLWFCNLTSAAIGTDISRQVFNNVLRQPYSTHVTYDSSDLIAASTRDIDMTVTTIELYLQALTSLFAALGIIAGLLILSWQTIFALVFSFTALYLILGKQTRIVLRANSVMADAAIRSQIQTIQEGLGSIRDVVLDNLYNLFVEKFSISDSKLRRIRAVNDFVATFPRYAFEGVGYILIALLGYYITQRHNENISIALLGSVAVGAQRVLPCLQKIFACWAGIKASSSGVSAVLVLLSKSTEGICHSFEFSNYESDQSSSSIHNLKHPEICLKSVSYRYCSESVFALTDIDLNILPGSCIGFIGRSGSGKSTLVDILMGLLTPTTGTFTINNCDLNDPRNLSILKKWQSSIAHVAQQPFLVNGNFVDNIAFCRTPSQIDHQRLVEAARCAEILNVIDSRTESFDSQIGEDGSLLSGGQKQRLGIARALYKQSNILVFDEATSALDQATESLILNNILEKYSQKTIIMIAHKHSSLWACSHIYRLESGRIVDSGSPAKMLT